MKTFLLILLLLIFSNAYAEQKIVQAIITVAPGGGVDVSTRHFEKWLLEKKNIKMNFVFKPGGESVIGTTEISNSPKNGSVVGFTTIAALASVTAKNNTDFDFISATRKYAAVLVTNSKSGIINFDDYIKKVKTGHDFKLGQGSANQKIQINFLVQSIGPKVEPIIAPYKGGSLVINDLLGGHIDVAVVPYALVKEHISTEKLKILASTGPLIDHPQVVVLSSKFKDFPDYGGYCMILPKNSDAKEVLFWRKTMEEYLNDPKVKRDFEREDSQSYPVGEKFLREIIKEIQTKYPS